MKYNLYHPRVLFKFIKSKVALVENYCRKCGRDTEVFEVPDQMWREVIGNGRGDVRCIRCFHRKAKEEGHNIGWHPVEIEEI